MANLGPEDHNFGVDVKLNLLQPGDRPFAHGPRVKVFREDPQINFSISLNPNPKKMKVIANPDPVIRGRNLAVLLRKVQKYRFAFLLFWYTQGMTISELHGLMQRVDAGEDLEPEYAAL